jgi:hypothetical protein
MTITRPSRIWEPGQYGVTPLEQRISYDPAMRAIYFAIVASTMLLAGCGLAEHSETCAPIVGSTRVVVTNELAGAQSSEHVITDSQRIPQLMEFADIRRKVSRPLYTMPAPQENAMFYDKDDFVASIGAGTDFLFVSCANWKGVRSASDAELREFKATYRLCRVENAFFTSGPVSRIR